MAYVSSVGREAICLSIYNPGEPVSLMPCRWEPYRHAIATVLLNSANDLRIPASRAPVSAKPASGAYEPNLLRLRAEVPSTGAVMAGERAVRRLSQGARNGLIGQRIPFAPGHAARSLAPGWCEHALRRRQLASGSSWWLWPSNEGERTDFRIAASPVGGLMHGADHARMPAASFKRNRVRGCNRSSLAQPQQHRPEVRDLLPSPASAPTEVGDRPYRHAP